MQKLYIGICLLLIMLPATLGVLCDGTCRGGAVDSATSGGCSGTTAADCLKCSIGTGTTPGKYLLGTAAVTGTGAGTCTTVTVDLNAL